MCGDKIELLGFLLISRVCWKGITLIKKRKKKVPGETVKRWKEELASRDQLYQTLCCCSPQSQRALKMKSLICQIMNSQAEKEAQCSTLTQMIGEGAVTFQNQSNPYLHWQWHQRYQGQMLSHQYLQSPSVPPVTPRMSHCPSPQHIQSSLVLLQGQEGCSIVSLLRLFLNTNSWPIMTTSYFLAPHLKKEWE